MEPSAEPSFHPTYQSTTQPTSHPTRTRPTSQPSTQPTGQPTRQPTTAKQVRVRIRAQQVRMTELSLIRRTGDDRNFSALFFVQTVVNNSRAQFLADANAALVFKQAIISFIEGLETSNIIITNVVDAVLPNPTTAPTPSPTARFPMFKRHQMMMLETTGITVDYNMTFIAQRILVENSNATEAVNLVTRLLINATNSGEFTSSLQARALAANSLSMRNAVVFPKSLVILPNAIETIVHSAKPTSQPSRQPSGQPSSQPSAQPTTMPSSQPSSQPSSSPTGQPTSQPTVSMETRWMIETSRVFEEVIDGSRAAAGFRMSFSPDPSSERTSYYVSEVSGVEQYGSCESWNHYLASSLTGTYRSKIFDSMSLVSEAGDVSSAVATVACSDELVTRQLIEALMSPFHGDDPALRLNVSLTCDAHRWVVQDCFPQGANAEYTVQYSPTGGSLSRAMCIDCVNPCAQYNCTGDPQSTVISPCTREANCPYLKGSLQVFTGYYTSNLDAGYYNVIMWFGVLWGFVIVSVLGYNLLIKYDMDWKTVRNVPKLTFRNREQVTTRAISFRAIAPEPAAPKGGLKNKSSLKPAVLSAEKAFSDLTSIVGLIFDRLLIAAGQNKAAAVTALAVTQRFWYRVLSYNHYLAPYTRASERERLVHGVNVLTRVSWLLFCVALCYWFGYEADDNSCYSHSTASECTERMVPFNSNEEYCEWVGVDGGGGSVDDGGQPIHQAQCIWHLYTGNVITIMRVVVVSIVCLVGPRLLYTNFLLECVILAPGGASKLFHTAPLSKECKEKSVTARNMLQKVAWPFNKVSAASEPSAPPSEKSFAKKTTLASASPDKGRTTKKATNAHEKPIVTEESDARMFSFSIESREGDVVTHMEAKDEKETVDLLYQSLLTEFTHHRKIVLTPHDEKSLEFEREWSASNPFMWNYDGGAMKNSGEDSSISFWDMHFPKGKAQVWNELSCVHVSSESLAPQYKEYLQNDADQFSVRLMTTFFTDLLGKDSLQTRLIRQYLSDLLQDRVPFRDVKNWVKFVAISFMLASCVVLAYGTVAVLQHVAQRRQWYWIITVGFAIAVDLIFVETLEALWFTWALPLCVADTLSALRSTVTTIFAKFQQEMLDVPYRVRSDHVSSFEDNNQSALGSTSGKFSMPNYQFVSTNLAHRFPRHLASRIVLSYESVYPRTITAQRWPTSATAAQVLCGTQPWSSGLGFESIGYVLFSNTAMWIAVLTPQWLQQMILTGFISLLIWLLVLLVHYTEEEFTGGMTVAGAVAVLLLLIFSSFFFSWEHDSEHSQVATDKKKNEKQSPISANEEKKEPTSGDGFTSATPIKTALRLSGKVAPDSPNSAVSASSPSFLRFSLNVTPLKANKVAPAAVLSHQHSGSPPEPHQSARNMSLSSSSTRSLEMIGAESKHDDIESNSGYETSVPIGVVTPFKREEYYLSSSSSSDRSSF